MLDEVNSCTSKKLLRPVRRRINGFRLNQLFATLREHAREERREFHRVFLAVGN